MKKTILFIITKSETGGAQKFVSEQINSLFMTKKWDFFLATDENNWLTDSISNICKRDAFFLDKRIRNKISFFYLLSLIRFIRTSKPDLIIANSANGGFYGRLAGFLTRTKVIYVSHGWSSIYNGGKLKFLFNFIEWGLSFISASILCISEKDRIKAIKILNIPPSKLTVIPNSILPIELSSKKPIADIVTVCRLSTPKRIDILLEAMSLLPELRLHIIGDGPLRPTLERLVQSKQLNNVNFLGHHTNFQEFNLYKIFCLISDSEGLPMSAIEAMSCGLPLVLSNVGGCPELIQGNGILVENNIHEIVFAIKQVLNNFEEFSNTSKNLFAAKFNLLNCISTFDSYYNTVINDR